jgi:hypothetical protein
MTRCSIAFDEPHQLGIIPFKQCAMLFLNVSLVGLMMPKKQKVLRRYRNKSAGKLQTEIRHWFVEEDISTGEKIFRSILFHEIFRTDANE